MTKSGRWKTALQELAMKNRVHVCKEMSDAYRQLAGYYDNCCVLGFETGEECGSWIVPPGWEVDKAVLTAPDGEVVADWNKKKLSLYTYSPSFSGSVDKEELEEHLLSSPKRANNTLFHFRNQYRYWEPEWGFSLPDKIRQNLLDGKYQVDIKTRFTNGRMEMVEQTHKGKNTDTLLLVGHFDHPEMCNDGLVGCLAGHEVISRLIGRKTNLTYRMLSTVEIIGSVFYANFYAKQKNVKEAMFVATSGASAPIQYQTSFSGEAVIDQIAIHVIKHYLDETSTIAGFRQAYLGNDEIAFDVGGVDIPCGSIMRAPFKEYHTDSDNINTVDEEKFEQKVEVVMKMIDVLERNAYLQRTFTGLPCLSSPSLDLYLTPETMSYINTIDGRHEIFKNASLEVLDIIKKDNNKLNLMMNVIPRMSEGDNTILDVAEKVGLPFEIVADYTDLWVEKGLIRKSWANPFGTRQQN